MNSLKKINNISKLFFIICIHISIIFFPFPKSSNMSLYPCLFKPIGKRQTESGENRRLLTEPPLSSQQTNKKTRIPGCSFLNTRKLSWKTQSKLKWEWELTLLFSVMSFPGGWGLGSRCSPQGWTSQLVCAGSQKNPMMYLRTPHLSNMHLLTGHKLLCMRPDSVVYRLAGILPLILWVNWFIFKTSILPHRIWESIVHE